MGDEYDLQKYRTPNGNTFWELVSNQRGSSDFGNMMTSPRTRGSAIKLIKQIDKIIAYGMQTSCATNKMRLLDAKTGLYELKGYDGAHREMTYILVRDPLEIVLLFSFRGHQGSGNIHAEIKKATPLAVIASKLLKDMHEKRS